MLLTLPLIPSDPFHAQKAALDAARRAYVDALKACDQAVRRGDDTALDALQREATDRLAALQCLAQQWLRRAAQQGLWTMTAPAARAALDHPPR